ncbi:hypothetical protein L227DRAFT_568011 [Lentinus tigrinus ALCF2SS1-6]|uniref:DUF6533 domain-containing protein n=1 Tax=Lentinus tigrinus ALCF2SS1-6 TaxID=1328759 RepID=A0A5C2RR71_9APHY|nr:hypothetical protein L227DRAFT_568011 [Lentinus tigrinus ALCF2SS1-6]
MSSPNEPDVAAVIDAVHSVYVATFCLCAVTALVFYEYIYTIGQEVDLFWKRKFTGATALFLANRYLIMFGYILSISTVEKVSDSSCKVYADYYLLGDPTAIDLHRSPHDSCVGLVKTGVVIYNLPYVPWAVFSALRAYVLTKRSLPLALFTFGLGMVPYGLNMAELGLGLTGVVDPIFGCSDIVPRLTPELAKRILFLTVTIASRTPMIISDLILIGVTWRRLRGPVNLIRPSTAGLTAVLLRDGMVYFLVIFTLNALHLGFTLASISVGSSDFISNVTVFTFPLTGILVSRFLLDLQHANQAAELNLGSHIMESHPDTATAHAKSTLVFERVFIGSIGSSLNAIGGLDGPFDEDAQNPIETDEVAVVKDCTRYVTVGLKPLAIALTSDASNT